jgi:quinol monooxygenase YgiN
MIVNAIHCTFAPEDADEIEAVFRELRDASLSEPGVVEFQVGRSAEKPNVFALWEVYRDREAAFFGSANGNRTRY